MNAIGLRCFSIAASVVWFVSMSEHSTADTKTSAEKSGKALYDFYCYQCHAYAGDGRTLAATYLSPEPRNFTITNPKTLTREQMIHAVTHGRDGTAMVSFATVIDQAGIERVVDFIRSEIMMNTNANRAYHTAENGWPNHQRFSAAFPFTTGVIPLSTPSQELSEAQQRGRSLYLSACISCHDHGGRNGETLTWDLRPLSYPRTHYSHLRNHLITGASPYAVHDLRPQRAVVSAAQVRGQLLFEENCAFCHAMDGTGKNWIGRFMVPHARDLTDARIARIGASQLASIIRDGLPGSSMPAWRDILSSREISDITTYVVEILSNSTSSTMPDPASDRQPRRLVWRRQAALPPSDRRPTVGW